MKKIETPELDKMRDVREKSQLIGNFLSWLEEEKYCIGVWNIRYNEYEPTRLSIEKLLAQYFEIDLDKAEQERSQLLESIRNEQI